MAPMLGVLPTMLVCFLIATKTNAASSGVDGATSELLEGIALLQKAGPSQQAEVHAALAKAHVGLSTKVFADGRAQDNRLSVGVYGCFEPRRCPDDPVAAAHAIARELNAPPLVSQWIDAYESSLESNEMPLHMLGFGVADDGAKLYIGRSAHSEEYPALPLGSGGSTGPIFLSDALKLAGLTDGLALEDVSLEWSVTTPDAGVRVRVYHSEPSILSALMQWSAVHKIGRSKLSVWAAQLARAEPNAQLIWSSPRYDPSTLNAPLSLAPTKLAVKASSAAGEHSQHAQNTALLALIKPMMTPAAHEAAARWSSWTLGAIGSLPYSADVAQLDVDAAGGLVAALYMEPVSPASTHSASLSPAEVCKSSDFCELHNSLRRNGKTSQSLRLDSHIHDVSLGTQTVHEFLWSWYQFW